MRAFVAMIKKEWLALARDVHGLLVLFVMPAAFILVMSLALRDTFKPVVFEGVRWQAWDLDGTEEAAGFLGGLPGRGRVSPAGNDASDGAGGGAGNSTGGGMGGGAGNSAGGGVSGGAGGLSRAEALAERGRALADGRIEVGVVVEAGFGAALAEVERTGVLVSMEAGPGLPAPLVAAFRAEAARALSLRRLRSLLGEGWPVDAEGREVQAERLSGVALLEMRHAAQKGGGGRGAELSAVQQSVPAWLVFAMFFVVIPLSTIFIAEKQQGTLPRLRSLRVPASLVALGKVAPFYAVNMAQTLVMLLAGRFVVPWCGGDALSLDVDWVALWVIASAVSLAAIGFALAVAAVARTTEQATTVGGVANILFAALGGVMVPRLVMPEAMQRLTRFSPMAWGLEGFQDVFARGAGAGGVLSASALLVAVGAAGFAVAWWRLRRLA
jgi:ABC-2 type transport system permease protein